MGDSDNSRTLPSICSGKVSGHRVSQTRRNAFTRKNLMSAATTLLAVRSAELRKKRQGREPGPTPAAELWQSWLLFHRQREQATKRQQKLERQVLTEAGSFPLVTLAVTGREKPVSVTSFSEIERLKLHVSAQQVREARSRLRRLRKNWKAADGKVGYSAALACERELLEREKILARVLQLAEPFELVEVIAKLHCLVMMEDAGLNYNETPWPELRVILGDLVRIEQRSML